MSKTEKAIEVLEYLGLDVYREKYPNVYRVAPAEVTDLPSIQVRKMDLPSLARIMKVVIGNSDAMDALERMQKMHSLMMEKVNHKKSFYDAECIREMNEAPLQAKRVLTKHNRPIHFSLETDD